MSRTAESFFETWICAHQSECRFAGFTPRQQPLQDFAQIADQRHIHVHVLVDFRAVDLDVNFLGLLRIGVELAGHAVVEAHAERDQQIGFLNGLIDPGFAVHAHHSQIQADARPGKRRGRAASAPRGCRRSFGELGALRSSAPERMMP